MVDLHQKANHGFAVLSVGANQNVQVFGRTRLGMKRNRVSANNQVSNLSGVADTCKPLIGLYFVNLHCIFTVRSTDKKCRLRAIDADRWRKVHMTPGTESDVAATFALIEFL